MLIVCLIARFRSGGSGHLWAPRLVSPLHGCVCSRRDRWLTEHQVGVWQARIDRLIPPPLPTLVPHGSRRTLGPYRGRLDQVFAYQEGWTRLRDDLTRHALAKANSAPRAIKTSKKF